MLTLSERERERLAHRIDQDVELARAAHARRMTRYRDYYARWRKKYEPPAAGDDDQANLKVPMIQWNTFAKWAQVMQSIFGDGARAIAEPTGPSDHRVVEKVGLFVTAAALQLIPRAVTKYAIATFRAILFGRSIVYRPWERITQETPEGPQVLYDGMGFYPCWPDDIIVPAEDVETLQDFSFVVRKDRLTPDDLLRGEAEGRYEGITEHFEDILKGASGHEQRDSQGYDEVKEEKDDAEGVEATGDTNTGVLPVWEWFGRWRMLKDGADDADPCDVQRRELRATDIVVRYLPTLNLVIGVERLMDLYPRSRNRRPFAEFGLVKDGSYWGPGYGDMLYDVEDEQTDIQGIFTEAAEMMAAPPGFYEPASGVKPEEIRLRSGRMYPVQNANGMSWLSPKSDLNGLVILTQANNGIAERVTGLSDQNMGRSIERPNAPRTAAGQIALIEQGNIRGFLDVLFFQDDFGVYLRDVWELYSDLAPASLFFRVTEEDAGGLIPTKGGMAEMTKEEFGGRFDFRIKFAVSQWQREAEKERQLQLYGLDMQNPLIATNPRALWSVTSKIHKALGDPNFADLVPEPPDMGLPKNPREEWTLALQGEEITAHPMDNDDLHLVDHYRRVTDATVDERRDEDAIQRMTAHILEHHQAKRTKMLMQALTQQLTDSLAQNIQQPGAGGLQVGAGQPVGLQQLQQHLAELTGQTGQPQQPRGEQQ